MRSGTPPAGQTLPNKGYTVHGAVQSTLAALGRVWNLRPDRGHAMPVLRGLMLMLVLAGMSVPATAQKDSTTLYHRIFEWSNKRKFTKWIYEGIFVPPRDEEEPPPTAPGTRRVNPFLKYKGRIIRSVEVRTFDPFGFSVDDTTEKPVSGAQRWANRFHRRTRPHIVRNTLLVRKYDPLDPLKVTETERILRFQPYVNDARLEVFPVPGTRDSVDILVLVHDKWSVVVDGQADLTSGSVRLEERNLMGWGHLLGNELGYSQDRKEVEWAGQHQVYNIGRSYTSSRVYGGLTPDLDQMGVAFDRPFYSPFAKWAGGFAWSRTWSKFNETGTEGEVLRSHVVSPANLDIWGGRSFILGDGVDMSSRSSHIIVAARYAQTRFVHRPEAQIDTLGLFRDNSLILVSTGLSVRQYYKERYLFRFGASEDVPEGLLVRVVTGAQRREAVPNEPYLGFEAKRGRNYDGFGYFSAGVGYGTFFLGRSGRDATVRADLLYFTDLNTWGRWYFRQFVRLNMLYGSAKPSFIRTNINGEQMYGFDSPTLMGTHKEVLNTESVFYAPYNVLGFRFAPVLLMGLGTIGNEGDAVFSGRIHSAFSIGILVRNENLLTSTFEVSLGFFPWVPDKQAAALVFNNFGNWSARTTDFIFPAPSVVGF
jgi:hypothetical protein